MKTKLFAIRDSKLGTYRPPMAYMHTGQAIREFEEACNDSNSALNKYSNDFTFYEIGTFDDETCEIDLLKTPTLLGTAAEFIKTTPVEDADPRRLPLQEVAEQ